MDRRSYLRTAGGGLLLLSGCLGSDNPDIKDSDGDGVIDSADYAPNDPDVQEKSDLVSTDTLTPTPTQTVTQSPSPTPTRTPSPTPTPTPSPTPTPTPSPTPSPTTTASSDSNRIVVDDEYWTGGSRIKSYSLTSLTTFVETEFPETNYDTAKLYVGLYRFPRDGIESEYLSSKFNRSDGSLEITVDVAPGGSSDELLYYIVGLVPGSSTEDNIDYTELKTIMESDPFTINSDGDIQRASFPAELSDDSGSNYSRNNIEGAYQLNVEGRTYGENWTVSFFAYKSAHAAAVGRARGRSRPEYVNYELTNGTGQELGTLLKDEADARGYSDDESVEFVIDFVQALPYVPDDVSKGFDDYTKFIMETMPEMGGDCEDTAIMLASILESDAFFYDMILIQPPGHMAAGIYQTEPEGVYYELDGRTYSYIETTGQGWGIGDIPEIYEGESAYLHQV